MTYDIDSPPPPLLLLAKPLKISLSASTGTDGGEVGTTTPFSRPTDGNEKSSIACATKTLITKKKNFKKNRQLIIITKALSSFYIIFNLKNNTKENFILQ